MNINEIEKIKKLISDSELEKAKAQGAKDSIKDEWKKKYGFETLEEAKEKLEELSSNLEKNKNKKDKLMTELCESQNWEEISDELSSY